MDRNDWLKERIIIGEERMDKLFSQNYDEGWGEIEKPHEEMIEKLLTLLPQKPYILDAACGTGKYWGILQKKNCKILGIDHSVGMLAQATKKYPGVNTKKGKLHELDYKEEFDAIICVDAMENVFPEHWPTILKNFRKGVKKDGYIYFTVEIMDEAELKTNFEEAKADGVPVVFGEHIEKGGKGGYHYYPSISQVRNWLQGTNLTIMEEREEGYYHHFLTKTFD